MSNSTISVGDFKEFYLQMSQPRSIRRLHKQLKDKFPKRKIISLATVFRHSQAERWKDLTVQVDSRVSEKILEKNVNKKVNEFEKATTQLELASQKSLELLLDKLKSITITDKVADLVGLNKIAVESIKMKNVLEGQPSTLSGHIQYDSEDVVKLKQHIQELYQSINVDLVNRTEQKKIDKNKLN
jgi:hypothetical protein